jgi:hypothetical protein
MENINNSQLTSNTKAIICALFLSRFDKKALFALGFQNWTEAFNVISLSLNVSYNSINQYRNIFDYYFPNSRKGWDKNKIGPRQKEMETLNFYKDYTFDEMLNIVQNIIFGVNFDLPIDWVLKMNKKTDDNFSEMENSKNQNTLAKRLMTGQAAENYFLNIYQDLDLFKGGKLEDTRTFGCGFDFKIEHNSNSFAVEVKGLAQKSGNLLLTDKEYQTAFYLKENFILFVVKNFAQEPDHLILPDPIYSNLNFRKIEKEIIQISYQCRI